MASHSGKISEDPADDQGNCSVVVPFHRAIGVAGNDGQCD